MFCVFSNRTAESAEAGAHFLPLKGRTAALLTALFHHDASGRQRTPPSFRDSVAPDLKIDSKSPAQISRTAERQKVVEFAHSLIFEGGYYPAEIYQLLGIDNPATARVGRVARQLDKAANTAPAPWEIAGRVGRSGMAGASDHWAMAPSDYDDDTISTPGTLAYLPTLAVAYAAYPWDGLEAAEQLAILKDDDLRAGAAARTAMGLLLRILVSESPDKNEWLRGAAGDSGDLDTERDIRSVRVKDWRYFRGEECAMGRLERAIFIWYKGDTYREIMAEGRENLRSREALSYLAALAGATYGMESLPSHVITEGGGDSILRELIDDLQDLAASEVVLRVAPLEKD
ncbi:MAG: hypothetical protein LBJ46_09335 [Planctomycetota bacterium]|jgi:hypothetical protein|nr:hypothetical protein [Planctomycetota bacterium]